MGMLDDILGGGKRKDEVEEIRENIDKIREKVQEGRRQEGPAGAEPAGGPAQPPQQGGERGRQGRGERAQEPPRGLEDRSLERREEPSLSASPEETAERRWEGRDEAAAGEASKPMEPSRGREARDTAGRRQREPRERAERSGPEPEQQGPTREDIPEPPELKDIDVPDIEKGPLFITVDKFRDALQAIADMRRVAADMESYIGSMEGTLQEDWDTADDIQTVLDDAEGSAAELQDIVSP